MICQNCGKNEANVRYTQIINGKKEEMLLCEKCYNDLGIEDMDFSMPIDFSSFFGDVLGDDNFIQAIPTQKECKCPFCGMTYDEFTQVRKVWMWRLYRSIL